MGSRQSPFETIAGSVVRERVSAGSKSDRVAVQLDTGEDRLILRRPGANPFSDPELEELVGSRVHCTGLRKGPYLFVKSWLVDSEIAGDDTE